MPQMICVFKGFIHMSMKHAAYFSLKMYVTPQFTCLHFDHSSVKHVFCGVFLNKHFIYVFLSYATLLLFTFQVPLLFFLTR